MSYLFFLELVSYIESISVFFLKLLENRKNIDLSVNISSMIIDLFSS